MSTLRVLFVLIRNILADRAELVTENLALRHGEELTIDPSLGPGQGPLLWRCLRVSIVSPLAGLILP